MGNYPYPSQYILNGQGTLPAWPVRVACEALDFPFTNESASNATLLEALREAVGVYYNYTGTLRCYDLNAGVNEESQNVEFVAGVVCFVAGSTDPCGDASLMPCPPYTWHPTPHGTGTTGATSSAPRCSCPRGATACATCGGPPRGTRRRRPSSASSALASARGPPGWPPTTAAARRWPRPATSSLATGCSTRGRARAC